MTFEEFQQSGRSEANLCDVIPELDMLGVMPGRVYLDTLYIEDTTIWPDTASGRGKGRWYTTIGNREYQSDALAAVERPLYEFAVAEGMGATL